MDMEICPLCSSRQHPDKKPYFTTVIIVFALLGFLCITLLGIMSANAIQQTLCSRTDFSNEKALLNVSRAKKAVDNYIAHHEEIPVNLGQISFQADEGVMVILQKTSEKNYRLIGSHERGDRRYFVFSEKETIYSQKKRHPGLHSTKTN
ncbi:MAG: hypothetical protein EG822_13495 [Deltaproteobacteria bacterium]|nr:hypothetical protein [Deltaproteobacteria bacterium]TLN02943.1 MAG: hypothetical protein FDZ73_09670 [bacterium]